MAQYSLRETWLQWEQRCQVMNCRAQELPRKFYVADQGSEALPTHTCGNTDTTTEKC